MKSEITGFGRGLRIATAALALAVFAGAGFAQDVRWLRVGQLQSFINEVGAEYEGESQVGNTNHFSWPAQYGIEQNTVRQKGLWIGAKNFYDTRLGKTLSVKVIGSGPRNPEERINMIFEKEIKLIGRDYHPVVSVDDQLATVLDTYDVLDSLDENLPCDRMVLVKFNTSIGVSVTKRVMAFTRPDQDDYYVHDYMFKNTGIIDRQGTVYSQTLQDLWVYFVTRYAFAGEACGGFGLGWGAFNSVWGEGTLNHAFNWDPGAASFTNPSSPTYGLRGYYSYYGPEDDRQNVSYNEDWGCPNENEDGLMGSAKFAGSVTLHADKSPGNTEDDVYQPKTTWYIASDGDIVGMSANVSQYDESYMGIRYGVMSEGHAPQAHDELIGDHYAMTLTDARRQGGGGTSQGQGFGPWTLAPGDSVRIVFAEGVNGIGREKNREVGWNWLQWRNNTAAPALILPDGSETTDHNAYKKAWVFTGVDSVLAMYRSAKRNFESGWALPEPPPPPRWFTVRSGGDRIQLTWDNNAEADPHFGGYVITRAVGTVLGVDSRYETVFECGAADAVNEWNDTTATRGFDYYYAIQSKDDGTQDGKTLLSGIFWTLTSRPANLLKPAGTSLSQVRVVPNPYDLRARAFQFGDESQYDRIAFYGLPPRCKVRVYTERGDLVWSKEHTNGAGDELWDSMTSSRQIVVSGIYLLYVEVTEDGAGFRKGESVIRKFVVIR